MGSGVEAEKEATENTKEGRKEGNWRKQLHPLTASKRAFLCPWAFRDTTGGQGAQGGDSCMQVLAACTAPAASWRGNGLTWLQKAEGWYFFLFSEELEKTES